MHAGGRQYHALGESADARGARTLADASGRTLGALAAAERWLASDDAADELGIHAATDVGDHPGVLVAHDERGLPREQALRRVDVRAADPCRVDGDHHLPTPGHWLGHIVDRELRAAAPRADFHECLPTARAGSLDDSVGALKKCLRQRQTERSRRLEIDRELELPGLLDRKVARRGATENAIDEFGSAPERIREDRPVPEKHAGPFGVESEVAADGRQPMFADQRVDADALAKEDGRPG